MRRLLRTVNALVLLTVLAGTAGAVQAAVAAPPDDVIDLGFVDVNSDRLSLPLIGVRDAYPGMDPHTSVVGVRNWGTTAASYDLGIALDGSPLGAVLDLTIRSAEDGGLLYRGPMADAAVTSVQPLAPGAAVHYRFTIRWDDGGPSDNAHQGQRTTFSIKLRGRAAS